MFENEGIIITEKYKQRLSIVTGSIWVTISLLIAGAAFKTIPLITSDIAAQGKLLRIIGYILGFFLIIGLNFIFHISYKIDLINNQLTIRNHFPFWTKTTIEKIESKRIDKIKNEKAFINSSSLYVKINNRRIQLYVHLHPSEVIKKIDYLNRYGFLAS